MKEIDLSPAVAKYLNCSPDYLTCLRASGQGPRFFWLDDRYPRYRKCDVDAWIVERNRLMSLEPGVEKKWGPRKVLTVVHDGN